jgi:diacylglycerol kinase (ATP)
MTATNWSDNLTRIIKAFFFSMAAVRYGWKNEAALRQELVLLFIAIPLAILISPNAWKFLAMMAVILLLLSVEFLNTAIEKLADRVCPEQDPLIKIAKDCGSAAVLMALIIAGGVWCLALWEWLT